MPGGNGPPKPHQFSHTLAALEAENTFAKGFQASLSGFFGRGLRGSLLL